MGIEQHIQQMMKEQSALRKELDDLARRVVLAPLNAGAAKELTISGGAIAATRPHITVLPESGTADNLDSITNFTDGKFVVVSTAQDGDTITVRNYLNTGGTGNIDMRGSGNDRVLTDPHDSVFLYYKESTGHWEQVGPDNLNSLIGVLIGTPADDEVLVYDSGTGNWINAPVPAGGVPAAHAPSHQHGGGDEVATATPGANAIPKADAGGLLNDWVAFDPGMVAAIDAATEQTVPEDTNNFPLTDTGVLKYITWANIKVALDLIYGRLAAVNTWIRQQFIDGSADEVQLRVQGHSSQTANLQTWENSSAAVGSWVDYLRRLRSTAGSYLKNSYFALLGENMDDASMTGMYDRNELANAARRGTVTVTVTGAGSYTNTVAEKNKLFDGSSGNYFTISSTDGTTTQILIHIDLGELQPNYSSQFWQPFVQYRLTNAVGFSGTWYRDIVVEVSSDNVNWYKPASGEWETTDAASDAGMTPGYWFGSYGLPGIPGAAWRYARFTLTDRQENAGYAFKDNVWIAEIGLRHRSAPWSRHFAQTSGVDFRGDTTFTTDGALATAYNTKILQSGAAIFNEQGADVDFRIEGDTDTHAFWVDASLDAIGMGISTLLAKLHVKQLNNTGNTIRAERDKASADTDGPVLNVIQDNTGDDQAAARIQQDGTGDLLQLFDGASEVFEVRDGGVNVITQPTLGADVTSRGTSTRPQTKLQQNTVNTTNATVTTLHSYTVTSNKSVHVMVTVFAQRTGGVSGAAGDTARYILTALYKNVSGTVTLVGAISVLAADESQAGWDATLDVSGTAVRVRVTGAASNNITWDCDFEYKEFS